MKKLLLIISLIIFAVIANAQSTPRFGITPNSDNTGRALNYKYTVITDAVGADSIIIKTNAYQTIYKITLVDALVLKSANVISAKLGDLITIYATCASGTPYLKFNGTSFIVSSATVTMTTNKVGIIKLWFNGTAWVETGRSVL